ncbi:MAG: DUF3301 domain-containing protein [Ectothiorhodospiraceae bacterium]|nr:DUF3301 domain-containing protein [Ectothiorhodospiraceae bacterium]
MGTALFGLLALAVVVIAWRDSMRAREHAMRACRAGCRSYDAQLLDDTVALMRVRPKLRPAPCLQRVYGFEITWDGRQRHAATVTLEGQHVVSIYIPERADGERWPERTARVVPIHGDHRH